MVQYPSAKVPLLTPSNTLNVLNYYRPDLGLPSESELSSRIRTSLSNDARESCTHGFLLPCIVVYPSFVLIACLRRCRTFNFPRTPPRLSRPSPPLVPASTPTIELSPNSNSPATTITIATLVKSHRLSSVRPSHHPAHLQSRDKDMTDSHGASRCFHRGTLKMIRPRRKRSSRARPNPRNSISLMNSPL
jgi:hypothetical protein